MMLLLVHEPFKLTMRISTVEVKSASDESGEQTPYISVSGLAYLSTENIKFPKGLARKLILHFIGPFRVKSQNLAQSTYTLELSDNLAKRQIHPTFHVSLLQPHHPSDDNLFPNRINIFTYEFATQKEAGELFIHEIVSHRFTSSRRKKLGLLIHWEDGDFTWEPYSKISELAAIDDYCQLKGVSNIKDLPPDSGTIYRPLRQITPTLSTIIIPKMIITPLSNLLSLFLISQLFPNSFDPFSFQICSFFFASSRPHLFLLFLFLNTCPSLWQFSSWKPPQNKQHHIFIPP
jgi:hypothetical protein